MPTNKNQHFVPRCYLKPFTWGDGRAINLYNITRRKTITGVAVRHQCARDYLYCKDDLQLEKELKFIEDGYVSAMRMLDNSDGQVLETVGPQLRTFIMLQYFRTDAAMQRVKTICSNFSAVFARATDLAMPSATGSLQAMMLESLLSFTYNVNCINDLGMCVLENSTTTDFVTSDDPVCMTSKFHADRQLATFGLQSTGLLLFLPLSPRLLALCYDANVYSTDTHHQRVRLESEQDVRACNDLQYLNAQKNIYFAYSTDRDRVECEVASGYSHRPTDRVRFNAYGQLPRSERGTEWYRRLAPEEIVDDPDLKTASPVHPIPENWPSLRRDRRDPAFLFHPSLAGYIRPSVDLAATA